MGFEELDGYAIKALDLLQLGAVCLLLAAKLNQPLSPSYEQMILLLDKEHR